MILRDPNASAVLWVCFFVYPVTKDIKETINQIPDTSYPIAKHSNKPLKEISYA